MQRDRKRFIFLGIFLLVFSLSEFGIDGNLYGIVRKRKIILKKEAEKKPEDKNKEKTKEKKEEAESGITKEEKSEEKRYFIRRRKRKKRGFIERHFMALGPNINFAFRFKGDKVGYVRSTLFMYGFSVIYDAIFRTSKVSSLGIRIVKWYKRWGARIVLDYRQGKYSDGDRVETIIQGNWNFLAKYYIPFESLSFARGNKYLKTMTGWVAFGPGYRFTLIDRVYYKETQGVKDGPSEDDALFILAIGIDYKLSFIRMLSNYFFTFDLAYGFDLTPSAKSVFGEPLEGKDKGSLSIRFAIGVKM